jgi:hypothetical protein
MPIISDKGSLKVRGSVAPWLWEYNLPRINLYYSAHKQNSLWLLLFSTGGWWQLA